ncbi:MAG: amino acid adenylation domain-containing protein [Gemmatimonadaceae bacterium]
MPIDRPRDEARLWRGDRVRLLFAPSASRQLARLAVEQASGPADFLLAAFLTLVHRYTGKDDVIVGSRLAMTGTDGSSDRIVPIRSSYPEKLSILELTARVRSALNRDFASDPVHANTPVDGGGGYGPAYQVMFLFGVRVREVVGGPGKHPDISLQLEEADGGFAGWLVYNAELFDARTIERMAEHLRTLVDSAVAEPSRSVVELPMLTSAERRQLLADWNDTAVEFPADSCLHELFEIRADEQPDLIAVICDGVAVSYGELNGRANQLAHFLASLGVAPDVLVGLCVERSIEMVVALLAIHKAGGAYVPLDANYPRDRLALMLDDSRVSVLLTQQRLLELIPPNEARIVCLDSDWGDISQGRTRNPVSGATPENLAYVIYTSGSTGQPKGAMLDHRGRVNNFCDFNRRFDVRPGDRLLALSSPSFDMSAYDVFGILGTGATVVLPEPSATLDPRRWAELVAEHGITIWHSVPALLGMFVDFVAPLPALHPRSLRLVLLGGDWIPLTLPGRVRALAGDCRVISMGGATEVSMDSTIYEIDEVGSEWKSIPYGAPMANQLAYVLDTNLSLVPIGVPGELHLGGIGVGRGYLNRPELTAEKFIPNPFRAGENIYKTGDLARWRTDGNLELLGRIDFQVKIRGFRVELGDIEASLRKHAAVRECVVLARGSPPHELRLVAYVVQHPLDGADGGNTGQARDDQVAQWKLVYDAAYSRVVDYGDPTFNIASWDSSYSEKPIPPEEMREWVDRTCERLLALGPRRVLEIGCGTGLLLFRIAPKCAQYVGIDISPVALDYVREQLSARPLPQVSLFERGADDLEGLEAGTFDTVVLNSVVLDFPDVEYLMRVLRGAARLLAPGGTIFIGDVRGLSTQEALATSVQLHRASDSLSLAGLRQRVSHQVRLEEELLLDSAFFEALPDYLPEIGHALIKLKRSAYDNEMAKFRYDVILYACDASDAPPPITDWRDWQRENLSVDWVRHELLNPSTERLAISRVPNARITGDVQAAVWLARQDEDVRSAGELRALAARYGVGVGIDPEEFWRIGEEFPYVVNVGPAHEGELECFDVVLLRTSDATSSDQRTLIPSHSRRSRDGSRRHANDPARSKAARSLIPSLRRHLAERLPEYMAPSAFVLLDAFPLSPNGKINRRALPEPAFERANLDEAFIVPGTPVEMVLADIWAGILGLDRVGIRDRFVQLGGSSLLAAQAATRIRQALGVEVALTSVYRASLAELAVLVEEKGAAGSLNVVEIARALLEIACLSDDAVLSTLVAGGQTA